MAEEKKRFPWWLVASAVVLVILAAVLGFIETAGRQQTIRGRFERLTRGMSYEDAVRVLGEPDEEPLAFQEVDDVFRYGWTEGPAKVYAEFEYEWSPTKDPNTFRVTKQTLLRKSFQGDNSRFTWWQHLRLWAEMAYAAIHGPRR